eukprot:CAMPEP_0168624388 /NCGR_PEP_ID=MMETSP0449_2-20121227/9373_1 /TAXON_ID=1082188 /ORGANISM="Strombidium rassoulzadegani, Strain ras09" /LENGTH=70 /DNA_ID=CAMNT_0008665915 /DNA_START=235 /DNA_END=444 /DNA_ORIENTATION=-
MIWVEDDLEKKREMVIGTLVSQSIVRAEKRKFKECLNLIKEMFHNKNKKRIAKALGNDYANELEGENEMK